MAGSNLTAQLANNTNAVARANVAVSSGKWYWEYSLLAVGPDGFNLSLGLYSQTGISSPADTLAAVYARTAPSFHTWYTWVYSVGDYRSITCSKSSCSMGNVYPSVNGIFRSGDTIGVLLDMDTKTLAFTRNGVSQGVAFTGMAISNATPTVVNGASGSGSVVWTANFGQAAFKYPVPASYHAGLW